MKRPLTTLMAVGIILFLAYLWRSGRLGGFLGAVLNPQDSQDAEFRGVPYRLPSTGGGSRTGGARGPRGGIGDWMRKGEAERKRRENPNDPILDDSPMPGSPGTRPGGTWRPRLLVPYPNALLLEDLN